MECHHYTCIKVGNCFWCLACHRLVTEPQGEFVSEGGFVCMNTNRECDGAGTRWCTRDMQAKAS